MRAALYHRISDGHPGEDPAEALRTLREHADARGWAVIWERLDRQREPAWSSLQHRPALVREVEAGLVDVVVIVGLDRLFMDLRTAADTVDRWLGRHPAPCHLVATADALDTTQIEHATLRRIVRAFARGGSAVHAERSIAGRVRALRRSGRPPQVTRVAFDRARLTMLYHGSETERPLAQREMARRLSTPEAPIAQSTLNLELQRLRALGLLDESRRESWLSWWKERDQKRERATDHEGAL
ncbi:MAG: recombinase family protein [Acidobacteriota bacterium]